MNSSIQMMFGASNALNKWLKAELPRLPAEEGKQAGVNTMASTANIFSWQVHIIDNGYQSFEKTIIVCEANSRFTFFWPVEEILTLQELTKTLQIEWQSVLAETLEVYQLLPRSDIAVLLSHLSDIAYRIEWVKNTDLSINGHISDAGLWVTDTLRDRNLSRLTPELAVDLAVYLNTQTRRLKQRKEKFIPVERLLAYCIELTASNQESKKNEGGNIINLSDYRRK